MTLVSPTVAELATFSGRASNTFNSFAVEALAQATLLLYLATGLEDYPTNPNLAKLTRYGIMDMADKIYLSQPYREASASPYQSETIGSYSYSKAANAVKKGNDTGVTWFDLAVSKVSSGSSIGATGSIEGMEWDGISTAGGKAKIIGGSGSRTSEEADRAWAWSIDTLNNGPEIESDFLF